MTTEEIIGQQLPALLDEHKVLTVHGSQGREWHTVILSVVDTSRMWFTDSLNPTSKGLNLINTAVSRAKERLIVVCNQGFWMQQEEQLIQGLIGVGTPINLVSSVLR